jgi:hypothetical protein
VYLFTGGLDEDVEPDMVAGDETVTAGTYPPALPRLLARTPPGR